MPINGQSDNGGFWIKAALFALGTSLGIAAKLATMRRSHEITMKDVVIETSIALAAAFFVWALFHYYLKQDDLAIIASVIVGRFGDKILLGALEKVNDMLLKNGNEK